MLASLVLLPELLPGPEHAQATAAFNLARVCEAWHGLLSADLEPAVPGPILELLGSH